jgi:phage terminase small subunit
VTDLTDKQLRFVLEYMIDNNGTQAAIRAGYSPNTAESQACRLLRNAKVRAEVEKRKQRVAESLEIDLKWLIREAAEVYKAAKDDAAYGPAFVGIKELSILTGNRIEKQETTVISHEDRLASVRERVNERRPTTH